MLSKILTAAALSLTLMGTASAELLRTDWKTEGDSQIITDIDTGIEWLRLSNTHGMSINQVLAETQKGGAFYGWRLPTSSEVQQMMEHVYVNVNFNDEGSTNASGYAWYTGGSDYATGARNTWRDTLGYRYYSTGSGTNANYYYVGYGLYLNDEDNAESLSDSEVLMSGYYYNKKGTSTSRSYKYYYNIYNDWSSASYTTDFSAANYSVYLVSDGGTSLTSINNPEINAMNPNAPQNVPVGGALAALLVAGAVGMRKKKAA